MGSMTPLRFVAAAVLAGTVVAAAEAADKPWELRVDLAVPVPVALPEVPAVNPFAATSATVPVARTTPMASKFETTFPVRAAIYADAAGEVRRIVFVDVPLPGIVGDLREAVDKVEFSPARSFGGTVPTWVDLAFALDGRVDDGEVTAVRTVSPDPAVPPVPDAAPAPVGADSDAELPATPVEKLEQTPLPRRFRARVSGREWTQTFRLLAEVSPRGRCEKVVFLSLPEGLRGWMLASLAGWTFQPAMGATGPVSAWVVIEGDVAVDLGTLRSDALRVTRESSYPHAAAAPAGGRPLGG